MKIASEKLVREHEDGTYQQTLVILGSPAELMLIDEALYEQGFVTKRREGELVIVGFVKNVAEHDKLINLVNSIASDIQLVPGLIGALDQIMATGQQQKVEQKVDLSAIVATVPGNGNGHNGHR